MKHRITGFVTGAVSGLIGALAFPPAGLWFLAWVALVPIFVTILAREGKRTVLPFLGFALAHFSVGLYWLSPVITPVGVVILAAIIWFLFILPMSLAIGFLVRRGIPLAVVAPIAWVTSDWLRTWLLTGFPWLFLAHSQAERTTLIQVSDVTGAWGITALIVLVNAALAAAFLAIRRGAPLRARWPIVASAAAVAVAFVYGGLRIGTIEEREGPGVLLVQACIAQGEKRDAREGEGGTVDIAESIFRRHLEWTRKGVREHPEAEVVIWPETMFPYRVDDGADVSAWHRRGVEERIRAMAAAAGGRPVIFGALARTANGEARNSVFQIAGDGSRVARYDKCRTVPGGEYVPLHTVTPAWFSEFVGKTIARFSGYYPDLTEGDGPTLFMLGETRVAPLICYEIIYPAFVQGAMGLSPQVLLNLSNYAWYPDTHQPEQAEGITIFRAVENRRPVVVSANNGISSIIDARGVVRTSLGRDVEGALFGRVPMAGNDSVYARGGNLFAWLCALAVALLCAGGVYSGRRGVRQPGIST